MTRFNHKCLSSDCWVFSKNKTGWLVCKLLLVLCVLSRITKGQGLKEEKSFMSGSNSKMQETVLEAGRWNMCECAHVCILSPIGNILQVIVLHAWKGNLLINSIWKPFRMIWNLATKKFVKINSIHLFLTNKISKWGIQKVNLQEYNSSASFRIHQNGKFYYP